MPRYFECPDDVVYQPNVEDAYIVCADSISQNAPTRWIEIIEPPTVTTIEMLFEPVLTQTEHLILFSSIALAFATAWSFKTIGKQILPR